MPSNDAKPQDRNERRHLATLMAGIILAVVLWVTWFFFQDYIFSSTGPLSDWSTRGQFGDSFGAINALFAAFGFAAVLSTLYYQQKQIRLAQDDQHKQRFEASYFELLRLLQEARKSLSFTHSNEYYYAKRKTFKTEEARFNFKKSTSGMSTFRAAWYEAIFHIKGEGRYPSKEVVAATYVIHIHNRNESSFSPYFRLLYTIMRRIHDDKILDTEEKIRYAKLLRSQLTSFELAVCGLNGLSEVSNDFDKLLVHFRLLKYIPQGYRRTFLSRYYPDEAFAARD